MDTVYFYYYYYYYHDHDINIIGVDSYDNNFKITGVYNSNTQFLEINKYYSDKIDLNLGDLSFFKPIQQCKKDKNKLNDSNNYEKVNTETNNNTFQPSSNVLNDINSNGIYNKMNIKSYTRDDISEDELDDDVDDITPTTNSQQFINYHNNYQHQNNESSILLSDRLITRNFNADSRSNWDI